MYAPCQVRFQALCLVCCKPLHNQYSNIAQLTPAQQQSGFCRAIGFRTVLAVHGVAICYYLGPTRSASLTLRCALACAGYKFCETLVKSAPSGVCSITCKLL